jgi:beta-lactamase class A
VSGDLLWQKLDAHVGKASDKSDGVMGVTIVDLTDGRAILKNTDHVFPTASSIKIAILLELYRQEQNGNAKLNDVYTFDPKDLVEDSQIMAGLSPGLTKITNRDLAQFMVAVSDNAAELLDAAVRRSTRTGKETR